VQGSIKKTVGTNARCSKIIKSKRAGGMAQVVESLPGKPKALHSDPGSIQTTNRKALQNQSQRNNSLTLFSQY
jgi:hypothetical protein